MEYREKKEKRGRNVGEGRYIEKMEWRTVKRKNIRGEKLKKKERKGIYRKEGI